MERDEQTCVLVDSGHSFKLLLEDIPSIVFVGYADWSVDLADGKVEKITGYSRDLFQSRRMKWSDIVVAEDFCDMKSIFLNALRSDRQYVRDYRIRDIEGCVRWIRERGAIICNDDGRIDRVCGVFHDVTESRLAQEELNQYRERLEVLVEEKTRDLLTLNQQLRNEILERQRIEDSLRESEELYRTLAENFPNGAVLLLDLDLRCMIAEGTGLAGLGVDKTTVRGKHIAAIFPEDMKELIESHFGFAIKGAEVNFEVALGQQVWSIFVIPVRGRHGHIFAKMVMTQNITDRKLLENRLRGDATTDSLTGLFNRRHLLDVLNAAAKYSKRYRAPLSVCMCDVDSFKEINDTFGHPTGDTVLAQYGKIILENIRDADSAGRYGGDEFCVVLPNTAAKGAQVFMERIRDRIEKKVFQSLSGMIFHATGSFGISELNEEDIGATDLLARADSALYEAKQSGRNRVALSQPAGQV